MASTDLAAKRCEPCRGGLAPMDRATAQTYLVQVPGWSLRGDPDRVERRFTVRDFAEAQDFAIRVGTVCEAEGHHADIAYGWGYCTVSFWTHAVGGLHENDFVMAAKVDGLYAQPYVPAAASEGDVSPTARQR